MWVKAYTSCLSAVKIREVMRATSYLLPPCQRTIARFMNLSGVIKWSRRIQKAYPSLTKQEQETFAFTRTYSKVVKELDCIFEFVNESLKLIKTKFGAYKFRKSKNQLNGITSYVLVLPLLAKMGEGYKPSSVDFKFCLEHVFMKDLETWKTNNPTENLAVKRKLKLAS
ncbi:MAG: hypothetical protein LBT78_00655 [Tannerella sp.]|jgi:hypothetical protein|nr:hypothetical protein [Tannerella sp.]